MTLHYRESDHAAPGKSGADHDVVAGRFVDLVPGARVVQQAGFESDDPAFAGAMRITWIFEPAPGGTCVTVRCENVPPGISAEDHAAGLASSLDNLAAFAA
jgi:uncharacterized protein YndB with AHSA1/START domain